MDIDAPEAEKQVDEILLDTNMYKEGREVLASEIRRSMRIVLYRALSLYSLRKTRPLDVGVEEDFSPELPHSVS